MAHVKTKRFKKITKRTKAIIVVNLFGMALDCTEFDFPNILILNDLCQSFDHLTYPNFNHGDAVFFRLGQQNILLLDWEEPSA